MKSFFDDNAKIISYCESYNPNTKVESEIVLEGATEFFRISMAHEDLVSYYKLNFALMQHHKYSLTELENMIPWEREIYVSLLQQYIEEENLKAQQEKNG